MKSAESEIKSLLERLTWWQRVSGADPGSTSEVKSTGEAAAAIDNLKLQLDHLGASFYWDAVSREYKLKSSREQAEEEE
jgi:hypothetical protein